MLSLNISCISCQKAFKRTDSIRATNCGHIFHDLCMRKWWQVSPNNCPQCKASCSWGHIVYINFNSDQEYETLVGDLTKKVQVYKEEIIKLKETIAKKDKKIDGIQRLYNVSEQWRNELQDKIHIVKEENENRAQKILQSEKDTEAFLEKIDELAIEISKLKTNIKDSEITNMALSHKTEVQEQRLKHVFSELQQQFADDFNHKSKRVSTENISMLPSVKRKDNRRRNRRDKNKQPTDLRLLSAEEVSSGRELSTYANRSLKECKELYLVKHKDCKIIITKFLKCDIVLPLEKNVISLAIIMSIPLTCEDILKIAIIKGKKDTNKVSLAVEFKSIEKKVLFLTHKNRLKTYPTTKLLKIKEYIDETIYPLFMYANRILRGNGYGFIICRNNIVIAKKKINDIEEIVIKNRDHVDSLLMSQITSAGSTSGLDNLNDGDKCDINSILCEDMYASLEKLVEKRNSISWLF